MVLSRDLETIFFILVASAIGLFAVYYSRMPKQIQNTEITSPLPNFANFAAPASISNTPTETPAPTVTTTSQESADGARSLVMKQTGSTTSSTYALSVHDTQSNQDTPIHTFTLSSDSSMSIPFNTFSPDDTYFFVKQVLPDGNHYPVFKSSGDTFADGKSFIDISPLFSSYTSNYTLSDITGWADTALLIVNAKNNTDSKESSFWFDVTNKSFIQLGNTFL